MAAHPRDRKPATLPTPDPALPTTALRAQRAWAAAAHLFASSRRAALWVALAHAILAVAAVRQQFRTLLPWTVEGFLAASAFALAFLVAWCVGLVGAAIGWLVGRRRGWPEAGAGVGVVGFWLGMSAPLAVGLSRGWELPTLLLLLLLPPLFAGAAARVAPPILARAAAAARRRRDHLTGWFSHHLQVRGGREGSRRGSRRLPAMDLRGVAVGALAGILTIGLAGLGAFDYLEAVSLASRVRLRNESVITPMGSVEWARYVSLLARGVPPSREQPIVLLEIDDATIARLSVGRPESEAQLQVLELLKGWEAARAVLPVAAPAPVAQNQAIRPLVTRRPPMAPVPPPRLRQSLRRLENAIREWDRVVLFVLPETFQFRDRRGPWRDRPPPRQEAAAPRSQGGDREARSEGAVPRPATGDRRPPSRDPRPEPAPRLPLPAPARAPARELPPPVDRLARAAGLVGSAEIGVYHIRQLPLLFAADAEGIPSVPLLLASLVPPDPRLPEPGEHRSHSDHRAGVPGPGEPGTRSREPLLVNVFGSSPGALFPRVSYTSILEERPLYDRGLGRWVPPAEFFRDRIVFLDSLGQPMHDTPIGPLSTTELLAMATDNLLTNNRLLLPPRAWQFSLMLVVGALMGSLVLRRSPLQVFQRFLAVVAIYTVTAVGLFVYPGVWAPIVPVAASALLAALLVLQFVFAADENERERSRSERMRLDQELAIGREIQTSLLPNGASGLGLEGGGQWSGVGGRSKTKTPRTDHRPLTTDPRLPASELLFLAQHGAFRVVGWSEPAREVGGDFYDLYPLDGDRLGLALGDVSGKGVPGALFMAVTMTLLQSHARLFAEPQEVLARTNEALYPRMRGGGGALRGTRHAARGTGGEADDGEPAAGALPALVARRPAHRLFVTAFYGVLDTASDRLCYASAGQTPPILIGAEGRASYLPARGVPLGALRSPCYERHEIRFQPGDRLVLASDGFVETGVRADGGIGPLGYDRFRELVARHARPDPAEHAAAILTDFRARLVDPEERDDLTLLIVDRPAMPSAGR